MKGTMRASSAFSSPASCPRAARKGGTARKLSGALCLLLTVCIATGCAAAGAASAARISASPQKNADAAGTRKTKPYTPSEPMEVYSCGDIQIGIPKRYVSQLTVDTTVKRDDGGTLLFTVSETASMKAAEKAGYPDDSGFGFLFSVVRMTRAQYEQTVGLDFGGYDTFAYRGTYSGHRYTFPGGKFYYACLTPTDVRYYRGEGGAIDPDSADFKNWEALCRMSETVRQDILGRNRLTSCDTADGISRQTYTYDARHAFVRYDLYYTRDGSRAEYDTLILSQPVRQGKGGIWCVERVSDEYGQVSLVFPGGGKQTAASYYEALQKQCDGGKHPELLTAMSAARQYVKTSGTYNDTPVDACFQQVKKLDSAYGRRNAEARALVAGLVYPSSGHPVDGEKLLACFGRFTAENWGVLERGFSDSDWWPPLQKALEDAAVGEDQASRDESILRLRLAYPKDTGTIAEGLSAVLQKQRQADEDAFSKALNGFSAKEQARVRVLLGYKAA